MIQLQSLWQKRKDAFWREVVPYFRYVGQSGFLLMLGFLVIGGLAGYVGFLEKIPQNYPVRFVSLAVLTPFVLFSSIRTFLRSADMVYLLRTEPRMNEYFRCSFRYSLIPQCIWLTLAYGILWLLYTRADADPKPFLVLWIVLLLFKLLNTYGSWQERRMSQVGARWGYRLLRWGITVLLIATWLWQPIWKAALFSIVLALVYVLSLRFATKHRVPWETLISIERDQRGRFLIFLNWFVDIPALPQKVYHRPWLNFVTKRISRQQSSAYLYLYTKTFLRSDVLGMVLRLIVLGMVILFWIRHSDWAPLCYGLFLFIVGMQLTAIRRFHRYAFWTSIYPLTLAMRKQAITKLSNRVHLVVAIILGLPLLWSSNAWWMRIMIIVAGLVLAYLFQMIWARKKWMTQEDDEDAL